MLLHLLQMGPSKVLTTFLLQIQSSWQLSLLELPPPCRNTVTLSSNSSDAYTSTVQSGPPLQMLHSRFTLDSKLLIPYPPIIYLLPLPPHLRPLLQAALLHLLLPLPPDSLRVLQWNAEGLRARSTELLHFLSSHPVDLICIQESNLNSSSSFRIPGFSALRSDRTHPRSGIHSPNATHASSGVVTFVRQGLSFSELSTSSLSSLDPYSDYVGVNISFNNSSAESFLNVYAPPICPSPTDGRTDSFSPFILPSSRDLFILGDFNCHHRSGTQEVLPRKYSTGSSLMTSSPSMTLTHPPFSIAPLAVAPLLTYPLLPLLLPFLAPGRCFRTWVLTIYRFFYPALSLRSFAPTSVPLSFNFQKACWGDFTSRSLFSAAALFTSLALNAAKSSIPFSRMKRHPKAWWSAEVEEAVSERRKAFAVAHRSNEDRQAYITASRRASSVILRPRLRHGRRLTLLLHLGLTLNLYTLSFALSLALLLPHLPLLTFLTVLLPGNRLRSKPLTCDLTFPFLNQRPCVAEPEATSLGSADPRALWNLTRPFALLSLQLNFLRLPPTSPPPLPLAQTKLHIPY